MFLCATSRLVVATGIANIFVRDAWATNAAAMTLAGAYPDRFVLGLGVSHRPMVEMRGHDYKSPLSTMRSYIKDMRQARFEAVAPEHDPPLDPRGPRTQDAGALQRPRRRRAPVPGDPAAHRRSPRDPGRRPSTGCGAGGGPDKRARGGPKVSPLPPEPYMRLPNYRNSWLRQGFSEEDLSGDGSDRLAEGLVAWGSESDIHKRVSEHFSAGADQVLVQVLTDGPARKVSGRGVFWRMSVGAHRHRPRAELQPAHELQVDMLR